MDSNFDWLSYFNNHSGRGYLSTADLEGKTDIAVYGRPHVQENGRWAFIMNERRSFSNVRQNPFAAYAFERYEDGGQRFYLEREEVLSDGELYDSVISESRKPASVPDSGLNKYVVIFKVIEVRPLVGD